MPELSIIIVHYRNPALLKLCLNSILHPGSPEATSETTEIIVVDSATTRESRDMVRENFSKVKLIPVEYNTGYAKGVNIGINESSGKFILILNQDTVVSPGAIDKMVNFIKDRPDIGLLGPQILNLDGSIQNSCFRYYTPLLIPIRRTFIGRFKVFKKKVADFLMADADMNKLQAPDWISGAAMLTTREAVEKVGLMDERFFFYFEDVDWAKRFWQNGYKVIYYPSAKIYHALGRGSKSKWGAFDLFFNKKTRWHIRSALKYFWKHRKKYNANQRIYANAANKE